jgi:hypothetical protein
MITWNCCDSPRWRGLTVVGAEDERGLTPLIYSHVNPYSTFRLDKTTRVLIVEALPD